MKIMFNDNYGLTEAVLSGRKTMTRRIVKRPKRFGGCENPLLEFHKKPDAGYYYDCVVVDENDHELGQLPLPYKVGEVVPIAQSYRSIYDNLPAVERVAYFQELKNILGTERMWDVAGWTNKMFVRSELMRNFIRILDLRFEHLRDISSEDIIAEGVMRGNFPWSGCQYYYDVVDEGTSCLSFDTAEKAFASLIDKVSGKGTWKSNPFVVAYTFELVKGERHEG